MESLQTKTAGSCENSDKEDTLVIQSKVVEPLIDDIEEEDPEEIQLSKDRNWFRRAFSNLGPGSMRASIFNLSILSIGIGCLTLPQKFGYLSIIFCAFAIIIAGIATYWTLTLLLDSGRKLEISNYALLVNKTCGLKWSKFLDCVVILNLAGIVTLYHIIGKLLNYINSL